MYYEDMDPNIKSQYTHSSHSFANLVSDSQLPIFGLKASDLLDTKQLAALQLIRDKKFTSSQKKQFR
jgi:hypothetical protein